jgi:hypothetical protein
VSWLAEVRRDTPGPPVPGRKSVWLMDDPNMRERIALEGELTAVDPPRSLAAKVQMPGAFTAAQTYTLVETAGHTLLTVDFRYTFDSTLARLFEPLVSPQARKKMVGDLARLKQKVESTPPRSS